jgi:hypothetical protein
MNGMELMGLKENVGRLCFSCSCLLLNYFCCRSIWIGIYSFLFLLKGMYVHHLCRLFDHCFRSSWNYVVFKNHSNILDLICLMLIAMLFYFGRIYISNILLFSFLKLKFN